MQLSQQLNEWTEKAFITQKWIEGIKKSWKSLVKEAATKRGITNVHPNDHEWEHIVTNIESEKKYWKTVEKYIEALRDELLVKRGFWSEPADPKLIKRLGKVPEEHLASPKISTWFSEIFEILEDVFGALENEKRTTDPQGRGLPSPDPFAQAIYKNPEQYKFALNSPRERTKSEIKKVDQLVSRKILRLLGKYVKAFGYQTDEEPRVSAIPAEPMVNHVGGITIIFKDSPRAPKQDTKQAERFGYSNPKARVRFLRTVKNVCQILKKAGLSKLCYGEITVFPGHHADEFMAGGTQYKASAIYVRQGDYIDVYSPDTKESTIIHELGHRYYYKYMSSEDRHNFDRWFGKVPAVKQYGSTKPEEDFATTFDFYFTKKGMTKAQRARFEQFLGRKRKLESVQPLRLSHRIMEATR